MIEDWERKFKQSGLTCIVAWDGTDSDSDPGLYGTYDVVLFDSPELVKAYKRGINRAGEWGDNWSGCLWIRIEEWPDGADAMPDGLRLKVREELRDKFAG